MKLKKNDKVRVKKDKDKEIWTVIGIKTKEYEFGYSITMVDITKDGYWTSVNKNWLEKAKE